MLPSLELICLPTTPHKHTYTTHLVAAPHGRVGREFRELAVQRSVHVGGRPFEEFTGAADELFMSGGSADFVGGCVVRGAQMRVRGGVSRDVERTSVSPVKTAFSSPPLAVA